MSTELKTIDVTPAAALITDMPESVYHSDPCERPSLSYSIAKILWQRTPLHAWYAHPRLNPDYESVDKAAFDLGKAAHDILLEGGTGKIVVIDAKDWRTNAAKEARAFAYLSHKIPMLQAQYEQASEMADEASSYLKAAGLGEMMESGLAEQTAISEYKGVTLRSRIDLMNKQRTAILDYKSVGQSADPKQFVRQLFNLGYDIQAATYTLQNRLTGGPDNSQFLWLVQETEKPYACSLVGASNAVMEIGEHKLEWCVAKWAECLASNTWPGYGIQVEYPDVPPWELARVQEIINEVN